jgi:hypothetical protein
VTNAATSLRQCQNVARQLSAAPLGFGTSATAALERGSARSTSQRPAPVATAEVAKSAIDQEENRLPERSFAWALVLHLPPRADSSAVASAARAASTANTTASTPVPAPIAKDDTPSQR